MTGFYVVRFLQPLASAYGLAKHRDGRWEWAIAPGVSPSPRYQHAAVGFYYSFLLNFPIFFHIQVITLRLIFILGFCQCTAPCIWRCTWWWPHGRRLFQHCRQFLVLKSEIFEINENGSSLYNIKLMTVQVQLLAQICYSHVRKGDLHITTCFFFWIITYKHLHFNFYN